MFLRFTALALTHLERTPKVLSNAERDGYLLPSLRAASDPSCGSVRSNSRNSASGLGQREFA